MENRGYTPVKKIPLAKVKRIKRSEQAGAELGQAQPQLGLRLTNA